MQSNWSSLSFFWKPLQLLGCARNDAVVAAEVKKSIPIGFDSSQRSPVQQKGFTQYYQLKSSEPLASLSVKIINITAIYQDRMSYQLNAGKSSETQDKIVTGNISFSAIEFTPSSTNMPIIEQLKPYLGKILRVISEQGNLPEPMPPYEKLYQVGDNKWRINQTKQFNRWFKKENSATVPTGHYAFVKLASENHCRIWSMQGKISNHAQLADLSPSVEYAGEIFFSIDGKGTLLNWNNQSATYPGHKDLCAQAGLPMNRFSNFITPGPSQTTLTSSSNSMPRT